MKGKLIVIEGVDCSGKNTQSNLLKENLEKEGYEVKKYSFPVYDSPTGKIVGGPFLGKKEICEGYFKELAPNVNYQIGSMYLAADRLYNITPILNDLKEGKIVILDRYTYSNMAHQGGKEKEKSKRYEAYKWIETLEFDFLKLPKPDIKIFLSLSINTVKKLKEKRLENASLDQNELDNDYLELSIKAYKEVCEIYNFKTINCEKNNDIRNKEAISLDILNYVLKDLKK